jgi:hypothetical protein
MNTDKENVKEKIKELSRKIKEEEEDWIWENYEIDIAKLIIDYSILHNIKIQLINYDLYGKDEKEAELEESYDFWNPFFEAIGEEGLINPRFTLHPDIKELVDCWNVE